jgi:hypothetical protein
MPETQEQINNAINETPRKWTPAKYAVLVVLLVIAGAWLVSVLLQAPAVVKLWSLQGHAAFRQGQVVTVDFDKGSRFSDADVALMHGLPYVEELDLTDTQVSSEGLRQLAPLDRLRRLTVLVERITPEMERKLTRENPGLFVEKIHIIDGRRVIDGWE